MSEAVAPSPPDGAALLGTAELATWVSRLAALASAGDDAERVDQVRLLEEVKGACEILGLDPLYLARMVKEIADECCPARMFPGTDQTPVSGSPSPNF